jgi:hypothetical protein
MELVHSKATIATPLLIKTLPLGNCFLASNECTESGTKLDFLDIKKKANKKYTQKKHNLTDHINLKTLPSPIKYLE